MDDWSVNDDIYEYYEKVWEFYTVNRIATKYKKNFVSDNKKYWCPDTECTDAFNASWTEVNNWIVPPPNLMSKVKRS